MKHIKKFKNINKDDISDNSIYLYQLKSSLGECKIIGKILKKNDYYVFRDYFSNNRNDNTFMYSGDINYNTYHLGEEVPLYSEHFQNISLATKEEINRYNLAISTKEYNL